MIVFREKIFYRANKEKWNLSELEDYDIFIKVEYSKKYSDDLSEVSEIDKQTINRYKRDLKKGFIYDDSKNTDDTEYLDKISKSDKYLVYSKKINGPDRFNYMIYKPEIEIENKICIIKVVVYSCKGHIAPNGSPYFDIK